MKIIKMSELNIDVFLNIQLLRNTLNPKNTIVKKTHQSGGYHRVRYYSYALANDELVILEYSQTLYNLIKSGNSEDIDFQYNDYFDIYKGHMVRATVIFEHGFRKYVYTVMKTSYSDKQIMEINRSICSEIDIPEQIEHLYLDVKSQGYNHKAYEIIYQENSRYILGFMKLDPKTLSSEIQSGGEDVMWYQYKGDSKLERRINSGVIFLTLPDDMGINKDRLSEHIYLFLDSLKSENNHAIQ